MALTNQKSEIKNQKSNLGFTLIELLVTITIITMLAGLVLGGLSIARTSAREMKTKATIAKLDEIILRMYAGYANRRVPIDTSDLTRAYAAEAKDDTLGDLMRMEMPQQDSDITTDPKTFTYGGVSVQLSAPALKQAYVAYRGSDAMTAPACLYMIVNLAHPRDMERFSPDEIGMDDGRPVFVDAWGNPIGFFRACNRVHRLRDSGDLKSETLLPLVYSAGQDGQSGLTTTGASDGTGAHYDNIHNHRLDIR